ncbi:MAG: hypothetical protein IJT18_01810 [Oscillospiraceae bacterium]|nr:hypothetical protein [Oscillospiraceae bacterium]
MTSKTSCFDRTLFRKTLRRFWPLWTAYLVCWLIALPLQLHAVMATFYSDTAPIVRAQEDIYTVLLHLAPFAVLCMAPLAAMAVFSYLYNDKRAGVFASLPVKREASFLSLTLAGLVPMLVTPVIVTAVTALVELGHGFLDWTPLLTYLGVMALYTLNFYGFAVLCAQLTGHLLIVPAVYAVLSFTAPVVELLATALVSMFVYGYQPGVIGIGSYLSPFAAILRFTGSEPISAKEELLGWTYHGWGTNAIYAGVGVVMIVLALLLYRKRRMETAGDVVAVRPLKKVFAFALGGGCALVLTSLLQLIFFELGRAGGSRFVIAAIGMSVGGFVGYFGAEMLMRKTFRVFGAAWRGLLVLLAVLLALLCAMQFDLLGWERNLPKAEDVESVSVYTTGYDTTLRDTANIEAVLRVNEDVLQHRVDNGNDLTSSFFHVIYNLRGGGYYERIYDRVPTSYEGHADGVRIEEELDAILNTPEAIAQRFPTDVQRTMFHYTDVEYFDKYDTFHTVQLTPEQAYEWYTTCILPDVADGTLGRVSVAGEEAEFGISCWLEIYDEEPPADERYTRVNGQYTRENYSVVTVSPSSRSVRTTAWLRAHGVPIPAER